MQSAARGRPPRRTHWPPQRPSRQRGARSSRAPGPQSTDTEGPGGWASRASQLRLAGGLRRHCEVPATGAPQPRSLPTLPGLGRAGKSSPCPRGTAKGCPRALCPAGRGVAPVPARHLSRAGPAPSLPPPPSSVRIAHPGTRLSVPNVLMGGSPPPPSFPSRSSCPRRPGGPWRAPEPSRWPRSGMPARGGHPARSARRLPASSRGRGCADSPQYHQLPVFHRLLIGGAVLLLAGGKHGAPLGRRRLRRDPRRVRAAATIPSREGGERAGKGHGGEGGAGRPVPRLLRRGCAAAPPGSPELRTPRPPGARIGNKWDPAVGNLPALSAAAAAKATAAATAAEAPREGGSERRREGRGQRAGEERGQDSGDAPPRAGRWEPPRPPQRAQQSRAGPAPPPPAGGPPAPTPRFPPLGPEVDRPPCYVNIE